MDEGLSIERGVLSAGECDLLLSALANTSSGRSRAGVRHLMRDPAIAELAHDSRLLAIGRAHLSPDAIPFRATLFDKSAERNWLIAWHRDTALPLTARFDLPGWGPWSRKFAVDYAHAPRRFSGLRVAVA
jgi:hypothetical protein